MVALYETEWREYCDWQYMILSPYCQSCDGFGDHGVEEESGCLYTCYACGGTGRIQVDDCEVVYQ